jgi:hypothetical protein
MGLHGMVAQTTHPFLCGVVMTAQTLYDLLSSVDPGAEVRIVTIEGELEVEYTDDQIVEFELHCG